MIRRSTLLLLALLLGLGAALFGVKHRVQRLEADLGRVNRAILADQEAIHVLKAEWAYLNRPQRLEALSRRHLELAPLTADQIVEIDDLPLRLDKATSQADNPSAVGGATPVALEAAP